MATKAESPSSPSTPPSNGDMRARAEMNGKEDDNIDSGEESGKNDDDPTHSPPSLPGTSFHRPVSGSGEPGRSIVQSSNAGADDSASESKKSAGPRLQSKWEEMFIRLIAYKEKYGDCLVPNRFPEDPQLGSWVSTQRRHYKLLTSGVDDASAMTPGRAKRLGDIGFQWSTKDPRHVPWEQRYAELADFRDTFGHAQVPIGWEENVQLSNWVSTQRQEYKLMQKGRQSRLSKERVDMLNKIDFIWEAQRGGPKRKRKATVAVPEKANPVEHANDRSKKARASKLTSSSSRSAGHSQAVPPIVRQAPVPLQQAAVPVGLTPVLQIPRMQALFPSAGFASPAGQWQILPNGAFHQPIPTIAVAGIGNNMFPIASPWPIQGAGYQFGTFPIWTGSIATTVDPQFQGTSFMNVVPFRAAVAATMPQSNPEASGERKCSSRDQREVDEDEEDYEDGDS